MTGEFARATFHVAVNFLQSLRVDAQLDKNEFGIVYKLFFASALRSTGGVAGNSVTLPLLMRASSIFSSTSCFRLDNAMVELIF